MTTENTLGVIVPFYNEEKFIEESILRLLKIEIIDQIVMVDDCSLIIVMRLLTIFKMKIQI